MNGFTLALALGVVTLFVMSSAAPQLKVNKALLAKMKSGNFGNKKKSAALGGNKIRNKKVAQTNEELNIVASGKFNSGANNVVSGGKQGGVGGRPLEIRITGDAGDVSAIFEGIQLKSPSSGADAEEEGPRFGGSI